MEGGGCDGTTEMDNTPSERAESYKTSSGELAKRVPVHSLVVPTFIHSRTKPVLIHSKTAVGTSALITIEEG